MRPPTPATPGPTPAPPSDPTNPTNPTEAQGGTATTPDAATAAAASPASTAPPASREAFRPLAGLRVVTATTYVAGPLAGMTLAQLGAQVLRIDPLGGSPDRGRWPLDAGENSLFWAGLNQGVRSVALDFRSPVGQELAAALITAPGDDAGLFVDNTIGRAFLTHAELSRRRPDLVHVHIEGHPGGRSAVDYSVNPRFGVPLLGRSPESERPVNSVVPAWDIATGHLAVSGLLAGLRRRQVDGSGSRIDLALADVAAAHVANFGWYAEAEERGGDRPRLGNHIYGTFGVDFACRDGARVIAVAITKAQWRDLVRITGTEEVFAALAAAYGADFDVEGERFVHRALIEAALAPWFARHPVDEVLGLAEGTRALVERYRSTAEVARAYRRGEESDVLTEVAYDGGSMLAAVSPLRWHGDHLRTAPPPPFGHDTAWALSTVLGLSDREVADLVDQEVVPRPPS